MKPAFWFSADVYKHEFCPAFAEEKPHDDGDWRPVYLEPVAKPLEWAETRGHLEARTPFGEYQCWANNDGCLAEFAHGDIYTSILRKRGGSLEEAKAAAEADWQRRILECLHSPSNTVLIRVADSGSDKNEGADSATSA